MTPYFNTPERVSRLAQIAEGWIGTPFHPNGRVRGAGVSCQMLPPMIYLEFGFMSSLAACSIPSGPMNWGHAQRKSLIEPYIDEKLGHYFKSILSQKEGSFCYQAGDLLGFKIGGCVHHLGLCLGHEFIHALPAYGVCKCRVADATWLSRIARIWRPIDGR